MVLSIIMPVWNQEDLVIKALDHLPRRDDIEVLVCDDGSTDHTFERLSNYSMPNLTVLSNWENKGVAYTKNRLLEMATGQYFHIHDSDDYVITDPYNRLIDEWLLKGEKDIICFDLQITSGERLSLNHNTQRGYCAQIARFIRKEFAEGIKFPEHIKAGDDWYFAEDLIKRDPDIAYTGVMAYHYNFPREGSLSDLQRKGLV